jgi:hypothetical protein
MVCVACVSLANGPREYKGTRAHMAAVHAEVVAAQIWASNGSSRMSVYLRRTNVPGFLCPPVHSDQTEQLWSICVGPLGMRLLLYAKK